MLSGKEQVNNRLTRQCRSVSTPSPAKYGTKAGKGKKSHLRTKAVGVPILLTHSITPNGKVRFNIAMKDKTVLKNLNLEAR